jgi:hypothetical protein
VRQRAAIVFLVFGLAAAGCGGDDDRPARDTVATPTATPPSGLPPEFIQCMADQGYAVESADDVHSAPQEVLQTCFGSLHEGGGR